MLSNSDYQRLLNGENFVIATDFDDTLVKTSYYPKIEGITDWFTILKNLQNDFPNLQIILFTCREGKDLQEAVDFCKQNGLTFNAINEDVPSSLKWKQKSTKPFAHIYVDDRALDVLEAEDIFL